MSIKVWDVENFETNIEALLNRDIKRVRLASYGYDDKLLEKLKGIRVKILFIIPAFETCSNSFCSNCWSRYSDEMRLIVEQVARWPEFDWRFSSTFSTECYIFSFKNNHQFISEIGSGLTFIIGGKTSKHMMKLFDTFWESAILDIESLQQLHMEQLSFARQHKEINMHDLQKDIKLR